MSADSAGPKKKLEKKALTPEEVAVLPRAGLWRRLAALLYDMFLVAAIWLCAGYLILFAFGLFAQNTSELVDGSVVTPPSVVDSSIADDGIYSNVLLCMVLATNRADIGHDCLAYKSITS